MKDEMKPCKSKSMETIEVPHDDHAVSEPELFDTKDENWYPISSAVPF